MEGRNQFFFPSTIMASCTENKKQKPTSLLGPKDIEIETRQAGLHLNIKKTKSRTTKGMLAQAARTRHCHGLCRFGSLVTSGPAAKESREG